MINFEDLEPNEKQDTRLILAKWGLNSGPHCAFLQLSSVPSTKVKRECGAGRCPNAAAAPATVSGYSRSNQATGLVREGGSRDDREPGDRPLTGINSFDGGSTEGALWVCGIMLPVRQQLLLWYAVMASRARNQVPTRSHRWWSVRTHRPNQSGKFADRPARPAER